MLQETCKTCKYSCRWCISKVNPENYSFYCAYYEEFYNDNEKCNIYKKDSRFEE